jgi:hypothetical protein
MCVRTDCKLLLMGDLLAAAAAACACAPDLYQMDQAAELERTMML